MLKWKKRNRAKANLIYDVIDAGEYYRGHAEKESRSMMNLAFNLPTADLEAKFIEEANAVGLNGLKGHRSIGGCRASIYNAFPQEGIDKLVKFMKDFEQNNPA